MDRASRLRWSVLISALGATVAAIFWPEPDVNMMQPPRIPSQPKFAGIPPSATVLSHQPDWIYSEENPFAPREWIAPPPPPAQSDARVVTAVEVPVAKPPPQLPFKFLGQMADGAERIVYLGLGEQVLLARNGDVLDGVYKVVALTPTHIEFELTDSGAHLALPLPAQEP